MKCNAEVIRRKLFFGVSKTPIFKWIFITDPQGRDLCPKGPREWAAACSKGSARVAWLGHASCGKPNDDCETEWIDPEGGGALRNQDLRLGDFETRVRAVLSRWESARKSVGFREFNHSAHLKLAQTVDV